MPFFFRPAPVPPAGDQVQERQVPLIPPRNQQAQQDERCCSERAAKTTYFVAQSLLVCGAFSFGVYECIKTIIYNNEAEGEVLDKGEEASHYSGAVTSCLRGSYNN